MSIDFNRLTQNVLTVAETPDPKVFGVNAYYLREALSQETQYFLEALVVLLGSNGNTFSHATLGLIEEASSRTSEYYSAILRARLPSRAIANETTVTAQLEGLLRTRLARAEEQSPYVDVAHLRRTLQLREAEDRAAQGNLPLVSALLYRTEQNQDPHLLVQLLAISPLQPSDALQHLKVAVRRTLSGRN